MERLNLTSDDAPFQGLYEVQVGDDRLVFQRNRRAQKHARYGMVFLLLGGCALVVLPFAGVLVAVLAGVSANELVATGGVLLPQALFYGGFMLVSGGLLARSYFGAAHVWVFDRAAGSLTRDQFPIAPLDSIRRVEIRERRRGRQWVQDVYLALRDGPPLLLTSKSTPILWVDEAEDLADALGEFLRVDVVSRRE
jgi:hypothetical protein